jgi:hypothetical protein
MKSKATIKHLETLDQKKELIILATNPTDWTYGHWTYGQMVDDTTIQLSEVYPSEDNGLERVLERTEEEDDNLEVLCYVIRMDC